MTITANRQHVTGNAGHIGAAIAIALWALPAAAQTAKEVKGTTPLVAVANEAPPKLIVDPPIPEQLAQGRVFIQYRTENLPVPDRKSAHPAGIRERRCGGIATAWTPSLLRG